MKKTLKIVGIVLISIVAIIAVIPFVFGDKIIDVAKQEINNLFTASVDFGKFDVSIFSTFPNLSLTINDLEIVGEGQFEKDTLISISKFIARVDIMSVITGEPIGIKNIEVIRPRIHALVAADSTENYDIFKSSGEVEEEEETEDSPFSLDLNHIEIVDGYIYYADVPANMFAQIQGLNTTVAGNFSDKSTFIKTLFSIANLSFSMDGVSYVKDMKFTLDAGLDADFESEKYTLKENKMSLNALDLEYDGWVQLTDDATIMDIQCKALKTDFKTILSLVPGVFLEGFEDIKTDGKLALQAALKGEYKEIDSVEIYPSFAIDLLVENASFQYPDLPKAVTNIDVEMHINNPSNNLDSTVINLQTFTMKFAENPFSMQLYMTHPMSDPRIDSKLDGVINLSSMKDFVPMGNTTMQGIVVPKLALATKLSDVEQENYEAVSALGSIEVTKLYYNDADMTTPIEIPSMKMEFTPQYVNLDHCELLMGKSDLNLSGKLENFIGYALANQTIKGVLTVHSKLLDANEIMGESAEEEQTETDSEEYEIIEVPGNIDFVLHSSFGQVLYDDYDLRNVKGDITIRNSKVSMDKLYAEMLDGELLLTGHYATPAATKPEANFALDIKNFDIAKTFKTFNTVQQLAPVAKYLNGAFSTKLDITSYLENDFSPILSSLNGVGELSANAVGMKETSLQTFAVNNLKQTHLGDVVAKNILMLFTIENGALLVKPFETNLNNVPTIIEGVTRIDQTIDYKIAMQVPNQMLGGAAQGVLQNLGTATSSLTGQEHTAKDYIDLSILATGTILKPQFKPVLGNASSSVFGSIKDNAKQKLQAEKDKLAAQAKAELDKKKQEAAAKIEAEKEKQKEALKQESAKQTDALKSNAKKQLQGVLKK